MNGKTLLLLAAALATSMSTFSFGQAVVVTPETRVIHVTPQKVEGGKAGAAAQTLTVVSRDGSTVTTTTPLGSVNCTEGTATCPATGSTGGAASSSCCESGAKSCCESTPADAKAPSTLTLFGSGDAPGLVLAPATTTAEPDARSVFNDLVFSVESADEAACEDDACCEDEACCEDCEDEECCETELQVLDLDEVTDNDFVFLRTAAAAAHTGDHKIEIYVDGKLVWSSQPGKGQAKPKETAKSRMRVVRPGANLHGRVVERLAQPKFYSSGGDDFVVVGKPDGKMNPLARSFTFGGGDSDSLPKAKKTEKKKAAPAPKPPAQSKKPAFSLMFPEPVPAPAPSSKSQDSELKKLRKELKELEAQLESVQKRLEKSHSKDR